jgi:HK97 family phage prohead protease
MFKSEQKNKKNQSIESKQKGREGIRYKSLPVEKAEVNEESMTVSGYLAAFNNIDEVGDMLLKGCFAKSLKEHGPESESPRKIIFCWQHDTHVPIGQFTKLVEDDKGLYFEANLDDIPFVKETVIPQYKSGTLNQHSIGFGYVWDKCEWVEKGGEEFFSVGEVKLYEGSVVTVGCNPETPFTGFKSLSNAEVEQKYKELEKITAKLAKIDKDNITRLFNSLLSSEQDTPAQEPSNEQKEPSKASKKSINKMFKSK